MHTFILSPTITKSACETTLGVCLHYAGSLGTLQQRGVTVSFRKKVCVEAVEHLRDESMEFIWVTELYLTFKQEESPGRARALRL